jgi:hypothetical protein
VILSALLLAAASPAAVNDDIVVLAGKLRQVRVKANTKKRDGVLILTKCRMTRGSGDPEIDAIPCAVAQTCADERPTKAAVMQACLVEKSQERIDALVMERRAARERDAAK